MPTPNFYAADDAIVSAYAQFISEHEFTHYITQTFKHTRRDATVAARAVGGLYEILGATHSFIAVEPHKLDGIHLHSLVNLPADLAVDYQAVRLERNSAKYGFYNISPLRSESFTVSHYCAKYVVKGNNFFLLGDSGAWKQYHRTP